MRSLFTLILILTLQFSIGAQLFAQNSRKVVNRPPEILITEHPLKKNALFKADSVVAYDINLQSTYKTSQKGTLSYVINTPHGKLIAQKTMPVSLDANASKTVHLEMPAQTTGFYKVDFMLNLPEYDDTVRRVFGVDIHTIKSSYAKPGDFNQFWDAAKAQLAQVAPDFKVTEQPERAQRDYKVYLVEMKSLGNITVRGWMTIPKNKLPNEKLPVYLVLPGYGANMEPIPGIPHFACLALNVRGLGNSRDVINPAKDEFITYNIHDKNKYILRGAIMDCERMLDFVAGNPDLDAKSIFVTGGSMGAYLSLVLAGLDNRVAMVAADNPTFSDFRWTLGYGTFPMATILNFAKVKRLSTEQVLKNLDYFDLKNFMPAVKANIIMAIGLLDNFAPPNTEMVAYNSISSQKQLFVYSNLGHEIDQSLGNFKAKWLYNGFHMFNRITGLTQNPSDATPSGTAQNEVVNTKFDTNPVGMMVAPEGKNASFKKSNMVFYNIDLKNNVKTLQEGMLTCDVTTRDSENVVTTKALVRVQPNTTQHIRMNLPLQKKGYFTAVFKLSVPVYKDTVTSLFGVDVDNLQPDNKRETISMVEHPGAKDALFSSKSVIYYNVDLKNNFNNVQEGMLSCEILTAGNKFVSLISQAIKLAPKATSQIRINLPSQPAGQYKASFTIRSGDYRDTLKRNFSVDEAVSHTATHSSEDETVSITEHPGNKDAVFKSGGNIFYNLDLKNNFGTRQEGRVSCQVLSMQGKVISLNAFDVNLPAKASKQVHMPIPSQVPGFYKVNFIINVNDYDDTVRRVFGVDIYDINSVHLKPRDFGDFWSAAKKELSAVEPRFKMIEKPELSKDGDHVYLIEMQSIGNITVRGWLTLAKDRRSKQKMPVYIALPGYGANLQAIHDMPDFAAVALNVRGLGNSNDVLKVGREEFLTKDIADKNKYILRGAIMDCIRAIDFICSRPECDSKSIFANGGSMGGYLSLVLASLDDRITICSAGNPAFSDWRELVDHNDFPMGAIQNYARQNDQDLNKILNNLDYFDLKNFVDAIKCKSVVGIGLLDNLAPPHTELPAYNNIKGGKKIFIFPDLGHQVGDDFGSFSFKMVNDNFGLF